MIFKYINNVITNQSPFKFYKKRYTSDELKVRQYEHKVRHIFAERYSWQEKLRRWIREEANIYIDEQDYKLN